MKVSKPNTKSDKSDQTDDQRTIGLETDVMIRGINGDNAIQAKVDTGADYCSLDARNIEIQRNDHYDDPVVKFEFNGYRYVMNVLKFVAVTSATGVSERPCVRVDMVINDVRIQDIELTLNDRSNMEYPLLIGLNAITAGKFNVSSVYKESISDDYESGIVDVVVVNPDIPQNVEINQQNNDNINSPIISNIPPHILVFIDRHWNTSLGELLTVLSQSVGVIDNNADHTNPSDPSS